MTDLTPDQVRDWLKENVTVVSPGETLVIRTETLTPAQIREYQQVLNRIADEAGIPFRCLIVFGDELGIFRPDQPSRTLVNHHFDDEPTWLGDIQVWRIGDGTFEAVHNPTAVTVSGKASPQGAIAALAQALVVRSTITINDAREALGLPRWNVPGAGE